MMNPLVQIDGFEQDKKVVVIAATNRKQDIDPALIRYAIGAFSISYMHFHFLNLVHELRIK